MKRTTNNQSTKPEVSYVAQQCDIEIILNHRRTVALTKRDGLFFVDDAETLLATESALSRALDKVRRLIKAGGL